MEKQLKVGQAIEVIRLKVIEENVAAFLDGRIKVDEFASAINGYVGTEILKITDSEFLMLIRWESEEAALEAQQITFNAPIITEWLNATSEFVSFDTGVSRYEN
ncbi:antibiotic biosynthesis monooxygenase family protein [Dyadobacter arcticus]|uniref:ABM domain-containing protein n=1 Tax=Dyadobacter arcticus TaxID=1078754 RepID=A0ABX0UMS5_9BACT|nr:antibiotic biosynthesis monooxygenase [Dyadobacter arcticus]NIJ52935.1 hypothetical protein [Dyadobacter arcticus]